MVWRNIFTIAGGSTVFGDSQQKRDPRIKVKCHLCVFPSRRRRRGPIATAGRMSMLIASREMATAVQQHPSFIPNSRV